MSGWSWPRSRSTSPGRRRPRLGRTRESHHGHPPRPVICVPARLASSARRLTLRLPRDWPWNRPGSKCSPPRTHHPPLPDPRPTALPGPTGNQRRQAGTSRSISHVPSKKPRSTDKSAIRGNPRGGFEVNLTTEISKVTDYGATAGDGVLRTPALVVDEQVLFASAGSPTAPRSPACSPAGPQRHDDLQTRRLRTAHPRRPHHARAGAAVHPGRVDLIVRPVSDHALPVRRLPATCGTQQCQFERWRAAGSTT